MIQVVYFVVESVSFVVKKCWYTLHIIVILKSNTLWLNFSQKWARILYGTLNNNLKQSCSFQTFFKYFLYAIIFRLREMAEIKYETKALSW